MDTWFDPCENRHRYQSIGANPLHPLVLRRKMDDLLNRQRYAKAAIDIAANDILDKFTGLRLADLLGGTVTEKRPRN
jgi:L-alanine-DL-glutamate epimerase-like enolase superfamily enzyme